ncbi:MAG TPA: NAD(P)H-dependent glycerol-3-phosphate dehydrogenase [Xanthobacteraceae bacterium]|nr:NAD(P)H-dependent glycerol-3-phosphate dehydrogenase [Xanthobacteraceae bacterium]
MSGFDHIGVVGAGAWGTALANVAARGGARVSLWARDPAAVTAMAVSRESRGLPGFRLDDRVTPTSSLAEAVDAGAVLLAVPAQEVRALAASIPPLRAATPVVACAKGIERGSRKFMTEVVAECLPQAVPAILSGPGFAEDVARGLPTAVTLAAADEAVARALAQALRSPTFRPYHATDVRGVEIGGAAKNVLAIAAGIVAGRALGAGALAALITRGFAELVRFGRAYAARPETLAGLSGLGDLILTCVSPQSRNYSLGVALAHGGTLEEAHRAGTLIEGMFTAPVLVEMANERGVDMPIAAAVAAVLDRRLGVDAAIESLMTRPLRAEV